MLNTSNLENVTNNNNYIIIDGCVSYYQKSFFSPKLKIVLEKNSKLFLYQILDDESVLQDFDLEVDFEQNSNLKLVTLIKTRQKLNLKYSFNLSAVNATIENYSLFQQTRNSDINYSLISNHFCKKTNSFHLHKTTLEDQSKSFFLGKVNIAKNSFDSYSKLYNKNLLFGKKANIITKPELEIECDQVNSFHGATTQNIPQNEIDYLVSKGLSNTEASVFLKKAFTEEIYKQFDPICLI